MGAFEHTKVVGIDEDVQMHQLAKMTNQTWAKYVTAKRVLQDADRVTSVKPYN
jgi:hypothetical protein